MAVGVELTSEAHAMVRALSADEAHPLAVALGAVVSQRDLHGGVHSRGSAHGEEDLLESAAGQQVQQPLSEHRTQRVSGVEAGGEIQLGSLLLDSLDDLGLVVASVDAPETGDAVVDLLALRRVVVHAISAIEASSLLVQALMISERLPEAFVAWTSLGAGSSQTSSGSPGDTNGLT